jgi:hypothetical protein
MADENERPFGSEPEDNMDDELDERETPQDVLARGGAVLSGDGWAVEIPFESTVDPEDQEVQFDREVDDLMEEAGAETVTITFEDKSVTMTGKEFHELPERIEEMLAVNPPEKRYSVVINKEPYSVVAEDPDVAVGRALDKYAGTLNPTLNGEPKWPGKLTITIQEETEVEHLG